MAKAAISVVRKMFRNMHASVDVHPSANVQTDSIGIGTTIWQFVVILPDAVIGSFCNINAYTFIENDVRIGNRVTIKCGVYLWDGIEIEDDVFIGPNATFINDSRPRSRKYPEKFLCTKICKGASIGANATILGGITIGAYSLIGAGSVVTKDVPPYALVYGNPARIAGKVNKNGLTVEKVKNKSKKK